MDIHDIRQTTIWDRLMGHEIHITIEIPIWYNRNIIDILVSINHDRKESRREYILSLSRALFFLQLSRESIFKN